MADVAADVPGKYDILINGHGYIFAREIDPNIPFRTQRAKYGFSPTFVTRQNVSGNFGDNQQDFWLTYTQKDWSNGEGLRFARPNDPSQQGRYWLGGNVNIDIPGQVFPRRPTTAATLGANATGACAHTDGKVYVVESTNLETIDQNGTVVSLGAHTAGGVSPGGVCSDGTNIFIGGSSNLRMWNGAAFSTFSATIVRYLAFTNNTLYGANDRNIYSFSTTGVATTIFTFKDADGGTATATGRTIGRLVPYGGQLAMLVAYNVRGTAKIRPEVWIFDGTSIHRVAGFPDSFIPTDLCVANELLLVAGHETDTAQGTRTSVYYYNNGSVGNLWRDPKFPLGPGVLTALTSSIAPYQQGVIFTDQPRGQIRYYNLDTGANSAISPITATTSGGDLCVAHLSNKTWCAWVPNASSNAIVFPKNGTGNITTTVISSLIDFDTSLIKYVRGVTIDGGGTGSVDLAYQLDDLDGAWTTFQTNASAGVEYPINQTCHSIGIRMILNGVAVDGNPIVKRMYVRAVPVQQTFRNDEIIIDCTGANGKTPIILNNGNPHSLDGEAQVANLRTAIVATTPFSMTDRFGTFLGIIEPETVEIVTVALGEFYVRFTLREV